MRLIMDRNSRRSKGVGYVVLGLAIFILHACDLVNMVINIVVFKYQI